jgi:hypothetical protein
MKKAVKSKGYPSNGVTEQIINFANMKHLILDAYKKYKLKEDDVKPMVADLSRVYLEESGVIKSLRDKLTFEKGNLQNMFVSKQFCVKLNKHITVQDSRKKFDLNWKNDKRQIVKKEEEEKEVFCIDTIPITISV